MCAAAGVIAPLGHVRLSGRIRKRLGIFNGDRISELIEGDVPFKSGPVHGVGFEREHVSVSSQESAQGDRIVAEVRSNIAEYCPVGEQTLDVKGVPAVMSTQPEEIPMDVVGGVQHPSKVAALDLELSAFIFQGIVDSPLAAVADPRAIKSLRLKAREFWFMVKAWGHRTGIGPIPILEWP